MYVGACRFFEHSFLLTRYPQTARQQVMAMHSTLDDAVRGASSAVDLEMEEIDRSPSPSTLSNQILGRLSDIRTALLSVELTNDLGYKPGLLNLLGQIDQRVQIFHFRLLSDPNARLLREANQKLPEMDSLTKALMAAFKGGSRADVLNGISVFENSASDWIGSGAEEEQSPEQKPSVFDTLAVDVPMDKPLCRLETAFLGNGGIRKKFYKVEDFVEWLYDEQGLGQDWSVRSAHLFRETDPIHHEYAIFGLQESSFSSWLRVERAARFKDRRHRLQADMFDPLFKGTPLRQQLWLGASKEDIISPNGREILVLSIHDPDTARLSLQELTHQISESSAISDIYLLFTENCRWFARRNILSLGERMRMMNHLISLSWKGKEADPGGLASLLGKDPNGGWQLGGTKGAYLQADSLVEAARVALSQGRPREAIPFAEEALSLLEPLDDPKRAVRLLIARSSAHRHLASALEETGELPMALHHMREACELSTTTFADHFQLYVYNTNSLVGILNMLGDTAEALNRRRHIVSLVRGLHNNQPERWVSEALSEYLKNWAVEICGLPANDPARDLDHAIDCVQESITIRTGLYELSPDLYKDDLSHTFAVLANVLDDRGDFLEALAAQRKAVDILKAGDDEIGDHKHQLAERLDNLACYAEKLGDLHAAQAAAYEANDIWKALDPNSKEILSLQRPRTLIRLSHYLEREGKLTDALDYLEEGLRLFRSAFDEDPEGGSKRSNLAGALMQYAHLLEGLGRHYEALDASKQTVDLHRLAFGLDPTSTRPEMARHMYNHAGYAASVEDWDEACEASMHAARLYQQLTGLDRDQYLQDYADALNNWGYNLKDASKPKEALAPWQEAIHCFRDLMASGADCRDELVDLLREVATIITVQGDVAQTYGLSAEELGMEADELEAQ
ncbi:uncharacterized protein EI90DRAFT_3060582 [Cantharellus anzutake]|uniref:uncharacterized protein n=1 Tax=Cantharellus anzutake TaxID=1750568 RepID=UPI001905FF4A|nr:uncharacterized protein EI90DRAFT_3060582 [Cantharellus anzutake]KAF8330391.1 hypothetical protein EI90DRAFT_3060582 [Cantharellus anzutake]